MLKSIFFASRVSIIIIMRYCTVLLFYCTSDVSRTTSGATSFSDASQRSFCCCPFRMPSCSSWWSASCRGGPLGPPTRTTCISNGSPPSCSRSPFLTTSITVLIDFIHLVVMFPYEYCTVLYSYEYVFSVHF